MSWTNDADKLFKWHKAARNLAIQQGFLKHDGRDKDPYEDTPYMTMFAQFIDAHGNLADWTTGQQALFDFGEWLQGDSVKPQSQGQIFHATITKHYGGASVTFGYQAVFDVPEHQQSGAYLYCVQAVNRQFEQFEKNGLAQLKPPTSSGDISGMPDTIAFISETLLVEDKGDGIYYKIKGAQFKRFGLRVWPEVLKEAGIEYEELSAGSYPLVRECIAHVVDGKARKVSKIA